MIRLWTVETCVLSQGNLVLEFLLSSLWINFWSGLPRFAVKYTSLRGLVNLSVAVFVRRSKLGPLSNEAQWQEDIVCSPILFVAEGSASLPLPPGQWLGSQWLGARDCLHEFPKHHCVSSWSSVAELVSSISCCWLRLCSAVLYQFSFLMGFFMGKKSRGQVTWFGIRGDSGQTLVLLPCSVLMFSAILGCSLTASFCLY